MANAAASNLVIFAPGLLGPYTGQEDWQASDWPELSLLQKLLTRADRVKKVSSSQNDYEMLFSYFNIAATENDFPLAALSLLAEGHVPGNDCWMRLDPVCLHADRTEAILIAHEELLLVDDEADALQESIRPLLEEWSVQLIKTNSHHWYARLPENISLSTTPIIEAKGLGISRLMPLGKDQIKWHGLMNEVQMLWHTHPVNLERQESGDLQASSVWMWGCGNLAELSEPTFTMVYCDDLVTTGLAKHNNMSFSGLDDIFNNNLKGNNFVCNLSWRELQRKNDPQNWFQALDKWQAEFLQPLFKSVLKNKKQKVLFDFGGDIVYQFEARHLRRWWRRTRSLQSLANHQE